MRKSQKKVMKKTLAMVMSLVSAFSGSVINTKVSAALTVEEKALIQPQAGTYGYYVDVYGQNEKTNMTPETNPSIGVLSKFLEIYSPGTSWDNGSVLNQAIHQENLTNTLNIVESRTEEMEEAAYLDDRRNQSYSVISGLGGYSELFKEGTNAGTTISDEIPTDATKVKYEDGGNENGNWAEEDSEYGAMVALVNTVRNSAASTSSAKSYYSYMRPFRWCELIEVESLLQPCIKSDPSSDGGFPSGHTNAAYLTAYALAYAMPERFQELITRASELGNNRIVAGMHSCLDVMGGRVMATAIAAAALNEQDNADLKAAAYEAARKLLSEEPSSEDDYADYQENKEKNLYRLTYGFEQTGDTTKQMVVPKGAEVLLETRLPYLDDDQRRFVLYTTGLESGYPVLDDAEGWGRLNLFEAANGYGSFVTDVTVTMNAELGGYNAADEWKNDIDGSGSLTKNGTGSLTLSGMNAYTGGTIINEGTIVAESKTALGTGDVTNNSTLSEQVIGTVFIDGDYIQDQESVLELNVSSAEDILSIAGDAAFDGTLVVNFTDDYTPVNRLKIISYKEGALQQEFENVEITGIEDISEKTLAYEADGIYLMEKESGR